MTDVIAGKNITGAGRKIPEVNNFGPANQEENRPDQPSGEMREKALCEVCDGHGQTGKESGDQELQNCSPVCA